MSSGDASKVAQGLGELRQMLNRKPPLVDLDLLAAIDQPSLEDCISVTETAAMWEQAQAAQPANEHLLSVWMRARVRRGDYFSAQKVSKPMCSKRWIADLIQAATKSLMVSKNKRQAFLQVVACAHLASLLPRGAPEKDRGISEAIAFKFMSTAANRIPSDHSFHSVFEKLSLSDKQALQTERTVKAVDVASTALQTARDLQFLIYILKSQGKLQAALTFLSDDSRTGLRSAIAAGSWELMMERIKLLEACEKWDELWKVCHDVLSDAKLDVLNEGGIPVYAYGRIGDDYAAWRGLAVAAANIGTDDVLSKTRDALHDMAIINSRHSYLAKMELMLHPLNPTPYISELSSLIARHVKEFRSTPSQFRDISHFSTRLTVPDKWELIFEAEKCARNSVPKADDPETITVQWIKSEVNSLKFDYNLVVSNVGNLSDTALLEAFAANALSLYLVSLQVEQDLPVTERRCGDDAAILAAMACIHLYHQEQSHRLLQCAAILEKVLTRSKHNYDAILLLIRVYLCQGAVSKAFELYERLDIKNIQTLTLSWLMLTRISTLHPHASKKKGFDPLLLLSEHLSWVAEKERMGPKLVEGYLESDNPKGLCETAQLIHVILTSHSHFTMATELIKIKASRHEAEFFDCHSDSYLSGKLGWSDVRDSTAVPSYEHHGQPQMDQYIRPGPIPSRAWAELQICLSDLRCTLTPNAASGRDEVVLSQRSDFFKFERDLDDIQQNGQNQELTEAEYKAARTAQILKMAFITIVDAQDSGLARVTAGKESAEPRLERLRNVESVAQAVILWMERIYLDLTYWQGVAEEPRAEFEYLGWQFLHEYHIHIEMANLYVAFLHILVAFSVRVKTLADGQLPHLQQLGTINKPSYWRGVLHDTIARADEMNAIIRRVVQSLQGIYRGGECVRKMAQSMLGEDPANRSSPEFREALKRCLEEDFAANCSRDLADSWVDCLDGML